MEELDPVVVRIGHRDHSVGSDVDTAGPVKLPVAAPPGSELKVERAVWVEDMDTVTVVDIGNLPGRADGDASCPRRHRVASVQSKPKVERAVWVEELDAVTAAVGHGDLPGRADGDIFRVPKLPVAAS